MKKSRACVGDPVVRQQPTVDPDRQRIADQEIARLRDTQRDQMIAKLSELQWAALRAARSDDPAAFDSIDAFTFEVLGSIKSTKTQAWHPQNETRLVVD